MAEGPPPAPDSRPRFFLDEERNNRSFMTNLGESTRRPSSAVPSSDAEYQSSVAAIRAIVDDGDDNDDDGVPSSSSSSTSRPGLEVHLDVAAVETSAAEPTTTLWTRLQAGWEEVEDKLVEWFGLDQSKYQWAIDEMLERQLAGDQPASNANDVELQMQNFEEQSMQRDLGGSNL